MDKFIIPYLKKYGFDFIKNEVNTLYYKTKIQEYPDTLGEYCSSYIVGGSPVWWELKHCLYFQEFQIFECYSEDNKTLIFKGQKVNEEDFKVIYEALLINKRQYI